MASQRPALWCGPLLARPLRLTVPLAVQVLALFFAAGALLLPLGAGAREAPASKAGRSGGRDKQQKPSQAELKAEGRITVVRLMRESEPQLTAEGGGRRWLLGGPVREELLRLDGHRVKVWGTSGEHKMMMPTIEVQRYDIVDSGGGRKPLVGVLRRDRAADLQLERDEGDVRVQGSPAFLRRLERRLGCKVWIVGDLEGEILNAFKFGWLRCAAPKPINPTKEKKETAR